eukprot:8473183-Ditylum_brightwellii.AAC.1
MAEDKGHDGSIIFTNRAGEEINNILPSEQYEDWPKEANLTGVALQHEQDCQATLETYTVEPNED